MRGGLRSALLVRQLRIAADSPAETPVEGPTTTRLAVRAHPSSDKCRHRHLSLVTDTCRPPRTSARRTSVSE